MKNEDLHTDKKIREKLEGFSAEPPANVWNKIQGQMGSMRRKRRMAFIGWTSAAAVLIFALIAGWMLNERSHEIVPEVVEQQISQQPGQEEINQETEQSEPAVQPVYEERKESLAKQESTVADSDKEKVLLAENKPDLTEMEETVISTSEAEKYELMKTLPVGFIQTEIEKPIVYMTKTLDTTADLSESDRTFITANLQNINQETEDKHAWIIGAHISPGYASHSASYSGQYSQSVTKVLSGGVSNTGGGVSVQYKTGKRLSIESGVYYAQNSQSAASINDRLYFSPSYDLAAGPATGDDLPSFSNAVAVSASGITMNSTAGVIKMRSTPQGAEINAIPNDSKTEYRTTLVTNGELSQEFDMVEIPLYLRYKILDKRFSIDVLGGLNAGVVVGNNAYIQNDFGKQNIGTTEDISTLNVSGTAGVGFSYALGSHFSLSMEPRFNYYLNSINTNPEVVYKPYRFGVFTGVYYTF